MSASDWDCFHSFYPYVGDQLESPRNHFFIVGLFGFGAPLWWSWAKFYAEWPLRALLDVVAGSGAPHWRILSDAIASGLIGIGVGAIIAILAQRAPLKSCAVFYALFFLGSSTFGAFVGGGGAILMEMLFEWGETLCFVGGSLIIPAWQRAKIPAAQPIVSE